MHEPTKDWKVELAKYLADPILSGAIQGIADTAKKNLYTAGHVAYRGAVTTSARDEVHLRLCNDVRGRDWIDVATGFSTKTDQGGGRIQEITVERNGDGLWLVSSIHTEKDTPC